MYEKKALLWDYCIRKTRSKQFLRIKRITTVLFFVTVFFVSANDSFIQKNMVQSFLSRSIYH